MDAQPIMCVQGCLVGTSLKQGIFCQSCARMSGAARRSAAMGFSMTMSLGWLYMRALAPNTGAVVYENKGKNVRHMILHTCL